MEVAEHARVASGQIAGYPPLVKANGHGVTVAADLGDAAPERVVGTLVANTLEHRHHLLGASLGRRDHGLGGGVVEGVEVTEELLLGLVLVLLELRPMGLEHRAQVP